MSAQEDRLLSHDSETPSGPAWWIGLIVGGGVLTFGFIGLMTNSAQTRPGNMVKWVLGGLIAHDAIVAPAVVAVSFLLARLLPAAIRGGIQATLAVCAVLVVMSYPVLNAAGRDPNNPSLLPHDYPRNLAIVLAAILAGGIVVTITRAARARTDRSRAE
ncbi:hypothetical protein BH20ACT16_BH20ACT16_14050 [soil metagenome]